MSPCPFLRPGFKEKERKLDLEKKQRDKKKKIKREGEKMSTVALIALTPGVYTGRMWDLVEEGHEGQATYSNDDKSRVTVDN